MAAKAGYHHGNLRRALLDEALRMIGERGVDALSLREVAAAVGVSHTAPYHHFADREALLTALAEEGMAMMGERFARAQATAGPNPSARLLAIGMAYVTFAIERPDYYAAISSRGLAGTPRAEGTASVQAGPTWDGLVGAVVDCQRAGELPAGDPTILGVYLWSLVHGLAELWRTGPLRYLPQASGGLEPLARQVLGAALGSLRIAAEGGAA